MKSEPHFLHSLLVPGASLLTLKIHRTGEILAQHLELASDSKTRTRGLLGRSSLADDSVMIIAPCNAIHTFFMRFTIDVVFVDREGRVLKLYRRLRPGRIGVALRAFAALEFAGGSVDRSGLAKGDRLEVVNKLGDFA